MKIIILFLTALGAASAFPSKIVDFETDLMEIEQEGIPGKAVEGEYSWVAPNGQEVYVKYIADDKGFRVIENENTIAGGEEFNTYNIRENEDYKEEPLLRSEGAKEEVAAVEQTQNEEEVAAVEQTQNEEEVAAVEQTQKEEEVAPVETEAKVEVKNEEIKGEEEAEGGEEEEVVVEETRAEEEEGEEEHEGGENEEENEGEEEEEE